MRYADADGWIGNHPECGKAIAIGQEEGGIDELIKAGVILARVIGRGQQDGIVPSVNDDTAGVETREGREGAGGTELDHGSVGGLSSRFYADVLPDDLSAVDYQVAVSGGIGLDDRAIENIVIAAVDEDAIVESAA